jgi:[acyl-carrier-protein] S-malonyltransferase
MGKDFFESYRLAKDTYETADRVLGWDVTSACFAGPEDRLNQTDVSQPAIYVTSIAAFGAAMAAGKVNELDPYVYAGLSLGEYTALYLAGVFGFEDGLKLVAARGKYMQEAAVAVPSGMVAIIGADETAVRNLCEESAKGEVLVPANFNAPGQIVVSGSTAACERITTSAGVAGFKAVPLKVAGAFHSPIMQPAADRMADEFERVQFHQPSGVPRVVYSNVTAEPHGTVESIKERLIQQIVKPVRWEQTMQDLIAKGGPEARFVELAPGRTLAGLAKRINRRLPVESLATADTLKAEGA